MSDQVEIERLEMLLAETNAHAMNKARDGTYTIQDDADYELDLMCIDHDIMLAKGLIDH